MSMRGDAIDPLAQTTEHTHDTEILLQNKNTPVLPPAAAVYGRDWLGRTHRKIKEVTRKGKKPKGGGAVPLDSLPHSGEARPFPLPLDLWRQKAGREAHTGSDQPSTETMCCRSANELFKEGPQHMRGMPRFGAICFVAPCVQRTGTLRGHLLHRSRPESPPCSVGRRRVSKIDCRRGKIAASTALQMVNRLTWAAAGGFVGHAPGRGGASCCLFVVFLPLVAAGIFFVCSLSCGSGDRHPAPSPLI